LVRVQRLERGDSCDQRVGGTVYALLVIRLNLLATRGLGARLAWCGLQTRGTRNPLNPDGPCVLGTGLSLIKIIAYSARGRASRERTRPLPSTDRRSPTCCRSHHARTSSHGRGPRAAGAAGRPAGAGRGERPSPFAANGASAAAFVQLWSLTTAGSVDPDAAGGRWLPGQMCINRSQQLRGAGAGASLTGGNSDAGAGQPEHGRLRWRPPVEEHLHRLVCQLGVCRPRRRPGGRLRRVPCRVPAAGDGCQLDARRRGAPGLCPRSASWPAACPVLSAQAGSPRRCRRRPGATGARPGAGGFADGLRGEGVQGCEAGAGHGSPGQGEQPGAAPAAPAWASGPGPRHLELQPAGALWHRPVLPAAAPPPLPPRARGPCAHMASPGCPPRAATQPAGDPGAGGPGGRADHGSAEDRRRPQDARRAARQGGDGGAAGHVLAALQRPQLRWVAAARASRREGACAEPAIE
jgi:hypothetical protein